MNTLEILEKLKEAQAYLEDFEYTLKQMESYYFKSAGITVILDTQDFNFDHKNRGFKVNKDLFKIYLESEIRSLDKKITQLMEDLIKSRER